MFFKTLLESFLIKFFNILGPFRGLQISCYHDICDDELQLTSKNLNFMKNIIDTLIVTMMNE